MLTFAQFTDRIDVTLRQALGGRERVLRRTEVGGDEVDWERGIAAVRVSLQSLAGVAAAPYRGGRRCGALHVIPMDDDGIGEVCALIVQHVLGSDPTEVHL